MLVVNHNLRIPESELVFTYTRSSGPGGQNVNKVSSKAVLRWSVAHSPSLVGDVRARFLSRFGRRLTTEGDLLITSQRYRDQPRNAADCLDKLRQMLLAVATPPLPRKRTKPTRSSSERRLKTKSELGRKKQLRSRPTVED